MSIIKSNNKLVVLWTSGDREVALNMVFMYVLNGKMRNWWKEVTLIVWGPSSKLLSVDIELQDYIRKIIEVGVKVEACKACSDNYKVSKDLENLGIEVKSMGEPLSNYLKDGCKTITI